MSVAVDVQGVSTTFAVSVDRRVLAKVVDRLRRVCDGRRILVLGCIQLTGTGERLHLAATDLVVNVRTAISANVTIPGSVCVPAAALASVLKRIKGTGNVVLGASPNAEVTLEADGRVHTMHGMSSDDFPALPELRGATALRVGAAALGRLLAVTVDAMSTDETRPYLCALRLATRTGVLHACATDGHRVVLDEARADVVGRCDWLIPAVAARELARLFPPASVGDVTLRDCGENVVWFTRGVDEISCRLVDGVFPCVEQVIPQSGIDRECVVKPSDLREAIDAIVTRDTKHVTLDFDPTHGLTLHAANDDENSARTPVPASYTGAPLKVSLNARYFRDLADAFSDRGLVVLHMTGELDPVKAVSGERVCVVMPMNVRGRPTTAARC